MSLQPKTYEDAKARYKPMKRRHGAPRTCPHESADGIPCDFVAYSSKGMGAHQRRAHGLPTQHNAAKRSRMKQRRNPKDAAWSKAVLDRDGSRCQWPGGCYTGDPLIDPHHKAERSQRPDLKYDVSIGIALCRTHHDWIPLHRAEALAMGLLLEETYEAAQKRKRNAA